MGKFPEKNLRELSAQLKASQKKEIKTMFIIVGVMAVLIGGLFGYILYSNPVDVQEHLLGWILGYLGIVAIIFLGSYLTQIGIIRGQFNIALREGYPELYKELKL